MARTIEVSDECFARISSLWRPGDGGETDILLRSLPIPSGGDRAIRRTRAEDEKKVKATAINNHGEGVRQSPRRRRYARKVRWVDDIRAALETLGGEGELVEIYRAVRAIREPANRSIAANFEATVRQSIQAHSSDSKNFEEREDYFARVRDGRWKLRRG